jgi:peptidoglycan/xylan/chitin deacetylase (PgdA/CDA1 family)
MPDGSVFRGRVDSLDGKELWVTGPPKAALLASGPAECSRMLEALSESLGAGLPHDLARRLYLRREDWRSLAALGMRVGAHSVGHPRLNQLSDEDLNGEVGQSVRAIAEVCSPVAFAYPDGAFDARVVDRVRAAGVSSAVTCEIGPVRPNADPMRLPRAFGGTG